MAIGPFLVSSKHYKMFSQELKIGINSAYSKSFSDLNEDSVQTIKIQLSALGLINVQAGNSNKGVIAEFISLTEKGVQYLFELKSIKKL